MPGTDFQHDICTGWEACATRLKMNFARVSKGFSVLAHAPRTLNPPTPPFPKGGNMAEFLESPP